MPKMIRGWLDSLRAFTPTNKNYFKFVKENIGLILLFSVMAEAFQHYFISADRLTAGTTSLNMAAKFGLATTSLLSLVFYQMIVPLRLQRDPNAQKEPFWNFVHRQTKPYFLESLRVLGKCLLLMLGGIALAIVTLFAYRYITGTTTPAVSSENGPDIATLIIFGCFLLPTIFYYLRYTFVPYIALIDPEYQKGHRDALKHSYKLMTGVTLPVIVIFAAVFKLESVRTRLREEYSLLNQPIVAFLLYIPFEMLGIYINILLFYTYQLKQDQIKHQSGDQTGHLNDLSEVKNGTSI